MPTLLILSGCLLNKPLPLEPCAPCRDSLYGTWYDNSGRVYQIKPFGQSSLTMEYTDTTQEDPAQILVCTLSKVGKQTYAQFSTPKGKGVALVDFQFLRIDGTLIILTRAFSKYAMSLFATGDYIAGTAENLVAIDADTNLVRLILQQSEDLSLLDPKPTLLYFMDKPFPDQLTMATPPRSSP